MAPTESSRWTSLSLSPQDMPRRASIAPWQSPLVRVCFPLLCIVPVSVPPHTTPHDRQSRREHTPSVRQGATKGAPPYCVGLPFHVPNPQRIMTLLCASKSWKMKCWCWLRTVMLLAPPIRTAKIANRPHTSKLSKQKKCPIPGQILGAFDNEGDRISSG